MGTSVSPCWEGQFKRIAVLDFSRDRKMMSVLATRKVGRYRLSLSNPGSKRLELST